MNRIDRLLGLLTLLQSRKYTSAEKISEHFNISVRTVYRDIRALCEQGIPVSFEQPRGYFIVQGYFLPPVSLTSNEANAMLLIESLVKGFSDNSIQLHYANALNKIKSVLSTAQKAQLEALGANISLQVPACFNSDFNHLSFVQQAISDKKTIEITYTNSQAQGSKRLIEPIGLVFYALNWHVIAWCQLRGDYRDFKVSRIAELRCTEQGFSKNDHIALKDYMVALPVNF